MPTLDLAKTLARRPVALGIVAFALSIGCSSSSSATGPNGGERSGTSKAAITSRGVSANGCRVHGVFDVTSPTAIDFVALDTSGLQNPQMQLFTVDGLEVPTHVPQTPQQASASMTMLLDSAPDHLSVFMSSSSASTISSRSGGQSGGSSHLSMTTSSQTSQTMTQRIVSSSATNGASHGATNFTGQGAQSQGTQNAASQSSASMLVFTNLSQLGSNHMMLVVDVTAKQASSLLRLFEGSSGVVTDVQGFPVAASLCVGGAGSVSASVPVVKPVALPQE